MKTLLDDITKRRFITISVAAWLLLLPFALTSTNWAIGKWAARTGIGCTKRSMSP